MDNNNEIVKKVFLIAVFILSIFTIVFFSRYDIDLSQDFSQWVNVAVYFNNIVTPILMFLSVFLLFLTWKNTREELVNSREILQKQMDMQVNSKKLEELELMFEKLNGFVFEHKWMNARAYAYF
ncbi:hypothetical protein L1273_23935, partial [Pseudoalteromonas sp. DL2-H6]|uniref:hypothetical protein n=1 Tax=Pseudoalteromonas sp. DL2-H6 TaxID=2908890 RepID=UPI001F1C0689